MWENRTLPLACTGMGRVEVNGAVVETSDGVEYGDSDRATC